MKFNDYIYSVYYVEPYEEDRIILFRSRNREDCENFIKNYKGYLFKGYMKIYSRQVIL